MSMNSMAKILIKKISDGSKIITETQQSQEQ
jgi:hypothetical protein